MPLIASRAGGSASGFGGLRSFAPAGAVDDGAMFPISSVILSSTTASVTFDSIPQTYTHLQIRGSAKSSRSDVVVNNYTMRLNSDTGSNYKNHYIQGGYSSTPQLSTGHSGPENWIYMPTGTTALASDIFTALVIDIADYKNTNKNTVTKTFLGYDVNGTTGSYGGSISLCSGLWLNTNAVTSITLSPEGYSWIAGTSFALYGIKGA